MDDKTTLTRSERTHIEMCVRKLYDSFGPQVRDWAHIVAEILRSQGVVIPIEKYDHLVGYVRAETTLITMVRSISR